MKNNQGGFIDISPIIKSLIWVFLLLIGVLVRWMMANDYFCFDERYCDKQFLNILE
ncbi:MAG: hypothetical protein Q7J07_06675 [Pelolinea sp.]|nr:hypothetical protein [Pelolinea sp.]